MFSSLEVAPSTIEGEDIDCISLSLSLLHPCSISNSYNILLGNLSI